MPVLKYQESSPDEITSGVFRTLDHLEKLMVAVIEFKEGPMGEFDVPHSHPHEQISYVAEGELMVKIGEEETFLEKGDVFLVPSNVEHTIKTLSKYVKLVDTFTPLRDEFLPNKN